MFYRVISPDAKMEISLDKEIIYNKLLTAIDKERQSQNLTWEQVSEKSGVPMGSIVYAFIENYSTFHVRINLDELIDICVALGIDICPLSVREFYGGNTINREYTR